MESKENIVFLGMMGVGKTSIGKLVSKKLKLNFIDTDKYIEDKLKMSISKIFLEKGESFFRDYEEKITLDILSKKNLVIALGGGAFLNKNIREKILKNHISFWLNLNNNTLIKRIRINSKRPVANKMTNNKLIELIKKRSNLYSKALYKVNCDNLRKNEVANQIIDIYETNKVDN